MTKYELSQQRKEAKRLKKESKKLKRLEKKNIKNKEVFEKKSSAKFKVWHRFTVKALKVGGPITGFAYVIWRLVGTFTIEPVQVEGKLNLDTALIIFFLLIIVGITGIFFGIRYIKRAKVAIDVASNTGAPSLRFNPLVIDTIRTLMGAWFFGLMAMFNYIGLHYGESLHNGISHMAIGYSIAFGSILIGDIFEQRILNKVRNDKIAVENEDRLMTRELYEKMKSEEPE